MISKEHKKHSDITRASYGFFARNEWAFVGGQCSGIKSLTKVIINALSSNYQLAYVDADHHIDEDNSDPQHKKGIPTISYTKKNINSHQFNFLNELNPFQYRRLLNEADAVLINGNHFEATNQVIIIDAAKKESLHKRLSQLTNVQLILLADNSAEVFDFVQEAVPAYKKIPVYNLDETDKIVAFFADKMKSAIPILNGLALAGGKSTRMGHDKGMIKWHSKEQQYYVADLLKNLCNEVYISCQPGQLIQEGYIKLADTFTGLGPFGAILSAFREAPDVAWMVIACDLPLLDAATLQYLKNNRNASSMATSFESPYNHFPEPLVTVWEPKSYPVLLSFLSQGYNCPAKALRNMDTTILKIQDSEKLMNVNTKEEFAKAQQYFQNNLHEDHAS
jgi:molybdopterin-guanine dinucleotide biosynthesis protein A